MDAIHSHCVTPYGNPFKAQVHFTKVDLYAVRKVPVCNSYYKGIFRVMEPS